MPFVKTVRGVYGPTGRSRSIPKTVIAGGDSIQISGGYRIHYYTTTGSSTFNTSSYGQPLTVEYLVVGGGGAGGRYVGGGGGAGGYISGSLTIPASSQTVTVGAGAASAPPATPAAPVGGNSVFASITATRGGPGGIYSQGAGTPGGSGGGAGGFEAGTGPQGTGTPGQGWPGGFSEGPRPLQYTAGAGGGGASFRGQHARWSDWSFTGPGGGLLQSGGPGITSPITGFIYAGGGGGGKYNPYGSGGPLGFQYSTGNGGPGGGGGGAVNVNGTSGIPGTNGGAGFGGPTNSPSGSGGDGGIGNPAAGGAGATNSGGGGGGAGDTGPWSAGGSGVVIVRYLF